VVGWGVNDLEGSDPGLLKVYYPDILHGESEEKHKIPQYSRYIGRDSNLGPPDSTLECYLYIILLGEIVSNGHLVLPTYMEQSPC
jgi:hypothetical protein